MKVFLFLIGICICFFTVSGAQEPGTLNKYKFVYLPQLYYGKGKTDIYGIRKAVVDKLNSCNVPLLLEEGEIPADAMRDPCSILQCIVNNTGSDKGSNFSGIKILFLDCKNDTVLHCTAVATIRSDFNKTRESFMDAAQRALEIFNSYQYRFSNPDSSASSIEPLSNNGDSIPWNMDRKLSWNDFKGAADVHDPADALTYTSHQTSFRAYGIGNRFNVESEVLCYFIRNKSWVKAGMKTDYLLNHEQRHFDLAEAGAREFRKKLKSTHFTSENFNREVQRITREIDEKYKKLQEQYDLETDHSRLEAKQNEWDAKINSMLKALEEFRKD